MEREPGDGRISLGSLHLKEELRDWFTLLWSDFGSQRQRLTAGKVNNFLQKYLSYRRPETQKLLSSLEKLREAKGGSGKEDERQEVERRRAEAARRRDELGLLEGAQNLTTLSGRENAALLFADWENNWCKYATDFRETNPVTAAEFKRRAAACGAAIKIIRDIQT